MKAGDRRYCDEMKRADDREWELWEMNLAERGVDRKRGIQVTEKER